MKTQQVHHPIPAPSALLAPGNIVQVEATGQGLKIRTSNSYIEISAYSPSVIRVRMDKRPLGRDFSYAVITGPETTGTKWQEFTDSLVFSTDSLDVVLQKHPFSIAFYTKDGRVINEDVAGMGTSWIGDQVTTYKQLQPEERFIGLGEKTGNLDRKGSGYVNWNNDSYGYAANEDPIYSSIPFYIGLHDHLCYGIFLDNTFKSDFNFGASNNRFSSFGADGGEMNYYFISGGHVADIITDYTTLTGRMPLPPLWSLGYQQNRYSYYPDTEVLRIAKTLREKKIPADGITLDIHYMEKYKLFTWDKKRFADPVKMNKELESMGFRTTVIVDPGIKVEKDYPAYEDGKAKDVFIKYPDGHPYTAQVWPGWCNFPDFTSERGRSWWEDKVKFLAGTGVDGIWNDMNEIASWGNKMPFNVLFDYDGAGATTIGAHNVYALEMARASYEGAKKSFKERPFILTRAGYAGLQRYTAIWTGDNRAEDDHMIAGIRLLNSLGLSGVAFTGMDIGGFTGNPSIALYARWIQIGAFTPYYRGHTAVNTKSAEPWTFGEEVTEIARNFIGLRYRLLPYIYSAFYNATQDGLPLMRSLAIDYSFDDKVYDTRYQNEYLFGPGILVLPFESKQAFGEAYFPNGIWYDLFTGEVQKGNEERILKLAYNKLPVYVKGGSIIPMQSLIQSTAQLPKDTLILNIYKGESDNRYTYYEDDGRSYGYQSGDYYKRDFIYDQANGRIILKKKEGNRSSNFKSIKLVMHGFGSQQHFSIEGHEVGFKKDFVALLTPISKFDPQGVANPLEGEGVLSHVIRNSDEQIIIELK
ncbi:glycoside hydrolase family 31 protein [Arachidicoccus terrestris]|uniref:glycoside hydrolase family 31 protein n=1 Tax=Arachidicoccus terrestris TaxID=2875539 RepID=UPI001CC78452|nr:glycoside hydrolase family 31 protein [Arachidicoccus terrestris]